MSVQISVQWGIELGVGLKTHLGRQSGVFLTFHLTAS